MCLPVAVIDLRSDAFGVRRVCPQSWGCLDPALLVAWNVVCIFLFTAELIPAKLDADDRTTQAAQGATQVIAGRRGHRTIGRGLGRVFRVSSGAGAVGEREPVVGAQLPDIAPRLG